MSLQQTAKFRPVLNQELISHICELSRRDGSPKSLEVLAALASFEWKIKSGAVTPAYTPAPKEDLMASMGFSQPEIPSLQKERMPETLYTIWADDPSYLSVNELEIVRRYRYENNKMTVDEEQVYEAEILGIKP